MDKNILIGVGVAITLVVVGGIIFAVGQNEATPTPTPTITVVATPETSPTASPSTTPAGTQSYTKSEVANHNKASDCWSIVDGNVYNLTAWISKHPGGQQAILKMCGTDGSSLFRGQHGTNAPQVNVLATFKIGVLAQ